MNYILNKLNGFNQNIQFTYKLENNYRLVFLDVLLNSDNDTPAFGKVVLWNQYLEEHI